MKKSEIRLLRRIAEVSEVLHEAIQWNFGREKMEVLADCISELIDEEFVNATGVDNEYYEAFANYANKIQTRFFESKLNKIKEVETS